MICKKRVHIFIVFLLSATIMNAQESISLYVKDNKSHAPISNVQVYNAKGKKLGNTDLQGSIQFKPGKDFPIFFEKKGYSTKHVYSVQELSVVYMQKMGGEIPSVVIRDASKIIDSLLRLRDMNRRDFVNKDTVLYYRFTYSLAYPDKELEEKASGYLELNYKAIGASPSEFYLYRYAYFTQFDYENPDVSYFENERLQRINIMPAVIMLGNDFMSGFGYPLWHQLGRSFLDIYKRDWYFQVEKTGERVFSAYGIDEYSRLLEEITFDRHNKLEKIVLFTPEETSVIGSRRFFDNFTTENEINSFRTIYDYTKGYNRVLKSMKHLSTFFEQGGLYYKMQFDMELVNEQPEEKVKIPLFYLSHNYYHKDQNGYGVQKLIENDYNIKTDRWLKLQDREHRRLMKDLKKVQKDMRAESQEDVTN